MKKLFNIGLIFLVIGLVTGGVALGLGAWKKDEWLDAAKNIRELKDFYAEPLYTVSYFDDEVTHLKIDYSARDIKLCTSAEFDKVTIQYYTHYDNNFTVSLTDGLLSIKENKPKNSNIFTYFNILPEFLLFPDEYKFFIYIPTGKNLSSFTVTGSSGNFSASDIDVSLDCSVRLSSGNITLRNVTHGNITLKVSSGNITVDGCTGKKLEIGADSGNLTVEDSAYEYISADASSGNINVLDSTWTQVVSETSSGNTKITGVDFNVTSIWAKVSSGNIRVNGARKSDSYDYAPAAPLCSIHAKASSGNITIS